MKSTTSKLVGSGRRAFLAQAAALTTSTLISRRMHAVPNGPISGIEHLKLHGDRTAYCGHPRQCGLFNFGKGELVVLHNHAPCGYEKAD